MPVRYRLGGRTPAGLIAVGIFAALILLVGTPLARRHLPSVFGGGSGSAKLVRGYAGLPQSFEPNRGQTDRRVDFLSHGRGYSLFLAGGDATLLLSRHDRPGAATALRMRLAGARPAVNASGTGRLPGTASYLRGRHPVAAETAIPTYRGVTYRGVYPGVDVRYYGSQRRLEYDFSLAPGADPSRIVLGFSGARRVGLTEGGDLLLRLPGGALRERAPVAFQVIAGARRAVAVRYVVRGDRVSFVLGSYDRSRPLTIDPVVLAYSTYIGGGGQDSGQGIAVDSAGAAYVTGWTMSTNFPATAFDTTENGDADVFVTKLAPDGKSLAYSTYLGGTSQDLGQAIAVDSSGSAYVTGRSLGTNGSDFPTTPGALDRTVGGIADAFVAKLAPDGQSLAYSTYLGGSDQDNGEAIAVDSAGSAYVTGFADSTDFPVTSGAFQAASGGGRDDFVSKLSPDGGSLAYSTYLGGTADEGDRGGIAVDSAGAAYVVGQTSSTDFPIQNAFDSTLGGTQDAYVTKLAPDGKSLDYSTYLGGSADENGVGVGIDGAGSAYVTGLTASADFPTAKAFEATLRGTSDAFVSKFAADGKSLAYSTYLGGGADENGAGLAVDSAGSAYVTGTTYSGDFPSTADAFDSTLGGAQDGFVSKLAPDGKSLAYSTYLGGSAEENDAGVAVDSAGAMYVTGTTFSGDFPTAGGPFDATLGGSEDAFVSKIADVAGGSGVPPPPPVPPAVVSFTKILSGPDGFTSQAPTFTFTSTVAGATFECQFDGAAFERCTTPLTRYRLPLGPHTFTVRAVTPTGHPDPQPDARVFTLGTRVVTGTPCKALIPRYDGHFTFGRCTVALGECPTGSRCTVTGTVNEYDDDGEGTKFAFVLGSVFLANEKGSFRDGGDCENSRYQDPQVVATNHCMLRTSAVRLGPEADRAVCLGVVEGPGAEYAGSDDSRYLTCSASMTIEPADELSVVVSGANGALIAPGAGALAISAALGKNPRAVAAAKRKPKPPFAPVHIKVKKPGTVKFRFKLSKAAERTLTRKHKLSLKLKISFKPTGAKRATARTQRVTLTHSVLPHCRPHKRVRCR